MEGKLEVGETGGKENTEATAIIQMKKMMVLTTIVAVKTQRLSHATTQMNLEGIMLSEIRSQSKKDKYCMLPLLRAI